jgi:hypothetical protein
LSRWFLGAPFESICQENVEDFVSYGFYDLHMHELSPEMQEAVRGAPPVHVLAFAVRQLFMGSNLMQ